MARLSSADLLAYTQEYVHAVFVDLLKQEGFVNSDGKDTIWYRVVNQEVVNTICFYTRWLSEPVLLHMGYGIHPLFVEPFETTKVYLRDFPFNHEVLSSQQIISKSGQRGGRYFSQNIPVMVPHGHDLGLYTLEGIILPKMSLAKTALDCYVLHKSRYMESSPPESKLNISFEQRLSTCSSDFINEGLFFEDTALYPMFRNIVAKRLQETESYDEKTKSSKWGKNRQLQLHNQYQALFESDRQPLLSSLDQQKKRVVKLMQSKYEIKGLTF